MKTIVHKIIFQHSNYHQLWNFVNNQQLGRPEKQNFQLRNNLLVDVEPSCRKHLINDSRLGTIGKMRPDMETRGAIEYLAIFFDPIYSGFYINSYNVLFCFFGLLLIMFSLFRFPLRSHSQGIFFEILCLAYNIFPDHVQESKVPWPSRLKL